MPNHHSLALYILAVLKEPDFPKLAFKSIRNSKARGESRTNVNPQLMPSSTAIDEDNSDWPISPCWSLRFDYFSFFKMEAYPAPTATLCNQMEAYCLHIHRIPLREMVHLTP
ncbi:hypothetical protein Csa_012381, partial [Cucumis sativus]